MPRAVRTRRPTDPARHSQRAHRFSWPPRHPRSPGTAVTFPLAITTVGEDAHRVDALLDLGKAERLADGVARLSTAHPESMMWACTSGSFVFGVDGAREQVDQVAVAAGVPASSTSIAFADALQHIGIAVSRWPRRIPKRWLRTSWRSCPPV